MSAKSPLRLAVHHSTKEVLQALVALRSTSDEHHPLLAKHHPIGIMQGMRPIHPVLWQPQLWQTRWSKESSRGWKIYPSQKIVLVDENQTETTTKTLRQQVNLAALPQGSVVHWKKWHHPHFDLLSGWPPRRKFELESLIFCASQPLPWTGWSYRTRLRHSFCIFRKCPEKNVEGHHCIERKKSSC